MGEDSRVRCRRIVAGRRWQCPKRSRQICHAEKAAPHDGGPASTSQDRSPTAQASDMHDHENQHGDQAYDGGAGQACPERRLRQGRVPGGAGHVHSRCATRHVGVSSVEKTSPQAVYSTHLPTTREHARTASLGVALASEFGIDTMQLYSTW